MTIHPGVNEIEWLDDIKPVAERVGRETLGFDIEWTIESSLVGTSRRPDVKVYAARGARKLLFTGEAKRPDTPEGAHALIASEVEDAVGKARIAGARFCFTTNFHSIALLEVRPEGHSSAFEILQGGLIRWIDEATAVTDNWWRRLPRNERDRLAESGLRVLFSRYLACAGGLREPTPIDDVVLGFFEGMTNQLVEALIDDFLRARGLGLPQELRDHALLVGLDPGDDASCQYLVAQGVAEVLTASLFHRVIGIYFSLRPILMGTEPASAGALYEQVSQSLGRAMARAGDYESIFNFTPMGEWVLSHCNPIALRHWVSLLQFIGTLDPTSLSEEILGRIFERLISAERRHDMGQHYTQPRIAGAMVSWAIKESTNTILDPSCGAGTFLVEAYRVLAQLGRSHEEILSQVFGNDLDPFAVHLASVNLATRQIHRGENYPAVRLGDAFDLGPGVTLLNVQSPDGQTTAVRLPALNAVVGNPPYGRYHPDPSAAAGALVRLWGVDGSGPPALDAANLASWFLALGAGLLPRDGRLAFVMPVGVLQNENLAVWRRWLRQRWDVVVWHTESDVWFSDARVATCVMLLEPRAGQVGGSGHLRFVEALGPAEGRLSSIAGVPSPSVEALVRDLTNEDPGGDILIAGTKPDALRIFEGLQGVTAIGRLQTAGVQVQAGLKLGHAFFRLADCAPGERGELRQVEGLGLQMRIPKKYLVPMLGSPKSLSSDDLVRGHEWLLLAPTKLPANKELRAYVRFAQQQGIHEKPSVRGRGQAWWSISPRLCRVAVPMSSQFRHEIAWFPEAGVANNNFNVVEFSSQVSDEDQELVGASLASAFGALSRLFVSGEIGCEGARRVLLTQFEDWHVLIPGRALPGSQVAQLLHSYRHFRSLKSEEMDVMSPDALRAWRDLTREVARAAGSNDPAGMADMAISICQTTVSRRRAREAIALSGRTRGGRRRGSLPARVAEFCNDSAEARRAVDLLSSGPVSVRIRGSATLRQTELWQEQQPVLHPANEEKLSQLLGAGFECSPCPGEGLFPGEEPELVRVLRALFSGAEVALIGERPTGLGAASRTWDDLADQVRTATRKWLQREIRGLVD